MILDARKSTVGVKNAPRSYPEMGDQARQRRPPPKSFCWEDGVTPARRFRSGCTRWILRRDSAPLHYESA